MIIETYIIEHHILSNKKTVLAVGETTPHLEGNFTY